MCQAILSIIYGVPKCQACDFLTVTVGKLRLREFMSTSKDIQRVSG